VTAAELDEIEAGVNRHILGNFRLNIAFKPLQQAIQEGAIALFGEKYAETVRNITIGEREVFSNELCGGTHVAETGDIGLFLITSEGSAAAGIRRIEAVTGRMAYQLVHARFQALKEIAARLDTTPEEAPARLEITLEELETARKQMAELRRGQALSAFQDYLKDTPQVYGVPVLSATVANADADTLRQLADRFRQKHPSGAAVLASVGPEGRPVVIAAVTDDLVKRGLNAVELVKYVAGFLGGGGGGRPNLAQAGGKDAGRLSEALASVSGWVAEKLK
jgi:alanyl-tRNA synthetase